MVQAWGLTPDAGQWNFPAWTLSAEFFAYLLFPAFVWIATRMAPRPLVFWVGAVVVVTALSFAWPLLGRGALANATQDLGIARGAVCLFVGVAARYVFEPARLTKLQAWAVAIAGAAIAFWGAVTEAPLAVVAAGASGLILGLATLDRVGAFTLLSTPRLEELGRWSYGLFILHVPIFLILAKLFPRLGWEGEVDIVKGAAMLGLAIAASWPAHYWVEEPARRLIRKRFEKRAQNPLKTAN
jgi:peptidoglycan/LPS O-acetylase OafA/YrhL